MSDLMPGVPLVAALVAGVLVVVLLRQRERAVRELRAVNDELSFYSRVVRATDSALIATDPEGRIVWANKAFERSSGWLLADVRGRDAMEFLDGPATDPDTVRHLHACMAGEEHVRVELALYAADGRESWVALGASPVHGSGGAVEGYFAVLTDLTERHEVAQLHEAARRTAELAAEEQAAFLATMSHEIRTPLNAVLGLTDLLLRTDLDEDQRDFVRTAHHSGGHLLALLNDVLDYSALESGRISYADEPFSVRGLLDETVARFAPVAARRGVALRLVCADDLPDSLRGDTSRWRQVLVNVVGNAVKFTEAGSVELRCDAEDLGDGRTELRVTVTDTGIGIPDDRIPALFSSFARGDASTTREHGGTGLGLAISRGLVEAMGGTIALTSEVGRGTRVEVRIAHERSVLAPSVLDEPLDLPEVDGLSVLVVEDDPVNRKVVTRMLDRLGIVPTVAVNGHQAVDATRATAYDVVLMDIEMPLMDGLTAARLIRAADGGAGPGRRPWLVALTANALGGDRERFLDAGLDDYLSKPVALDALGAALARVPERQPT
ncbi:PAS domain-containing hybrid sensor histidine kinase/response regulator [Nocardioides dongkuii]|uniref:PAS domain-containing hybrid sensor histidine kinase/response regulator n=1 Tax=Nocardioides dongkuii TaxID=2760089 RepID=UPI0015FE5151|nr:ATP-binding protein [Nocardioides dongkuii]